MKLLCDMQGDKWFKSNELGFTMFWVNRYVVLVPDSVEAEPGDATGWTLRIVNGWERQASPPAPAFITLIPKPVLERAFSRALTGEEGEPAKLFSDEIGPPSDLEFSAPVPFSVTTTDTETSVETTPALPQKDLSE